MAAHCRSLRSAIAERDRSPATLIAAGSETVVGG
jgi:hypothetical protein